MVYLKSWFWFYNVIFQQSLLRYICTVYWRSKVWLLPENAMHLCETMQRNTLIYATLKKKLYKENVCVMLRYSLDPKERDRERERMTDRLGWCFTLLIISLIAPSRIIPDFLWSFPPWLLASVSEKRKSIETYKTMELHVCWTCFSILSQNPWQMLYTYVGIQIYLGNLEGVFLWPRRPVHQIWLRVWQTQLSRQRKVGLNNEYSYQTLFNI